MKIYDAIVIGSGQAGTPLAKKLAKAGKKTALIEKRFVGGTCVNDGCTPTKTLVASARAAFMAKRKDLGIDVSAYKVDFPAIMQRKNDIVEKSRDGGQKGLEETENLDLVFGDASFTGKKTLTVKLNAGGEEEFSAELIFIDTGAKTSIPKIEGLETVSYLTSTTILDLKEVPESMIIIGGNYIGLEFGQMFSRFGSKITILEKGKTIMSREDADVSEAVTQFLTEEGINIICGAETTKAEKTADGKITLTIKKEDNQQQITASHLLIAAGRSPQTEALNLEQTGVEVDEKGYIKVNDKLETTAAGIYALGDVKPGPAFTHIAYNDHLIVLKNLLENADLSIKGRPVPYCMFTDPQLGRIGLSENEVRKQGLDIKVAKLQMQHVARANEINEKKGFMKAVVDAKTDQILGATVLGYEGGEVMAVLQMAMQGKITAHQLRENIFAHPTLSESINNLFMSIEEA
ncbi:mercuric reductase [Mucilaginibacter arboris]|uniref:FAD-binding protein n=1 Tax=Mucilaginibacter arboris TaxID=2682090 RepID=A0A7K1SZQ5_9SPHI|nr:mercuric reductase [Mucilaginibacter arboris]MVN22795.1 FAD-binding protein [Mucilaginibacter arboris]